MRKYLVTTRFLLIPVLLVLLALPSLAGLTRINQINLVSDISDYAFWTDPELVNPWGIVYTTTGMIVVADNGMGLATMYDPDDGRAFPNSVAIPAPGVGGGAGAPTGLVYNGTSSFNIPVIIDGVLQRPARLIFATEDGTIVGWNAAVNDNTALIAVDNSATGAVYMGLAMGVSSVGNTLYATNFAQNRVEAFNGSFQPVTLAGSFVDPGIPEGYAPFGIANLKGTIFVTYALALPGTSEVVEGAGNGYVSAFDTNGNFLYRFVSRGELNAPWGMVAVKKYNNFTNAIIIGNFGDGQLNAYNASSGKFAGKVGGPPDVAVTIEGLLGLAQPPSNLIYEQNNIYFAAGIFDGMDGLMGILQSVPRR